jgi:hypothetical protein
MDDRHEALILDSSNEKGECMLLDRLPIELRLRIWELVIGEQVLHLVCEPGQIGMYTLR